MTNSNNVTIDKGLTRKSGGRLSPISLLAMTAGIVAAPAGAQDMISPVDMPMQSPVVAPQPAQAPAPMVQSPLPTAGKTDAEPAATPERANDLAQKGGFDVATVAPEALAQIEAEQQARKATAAVSAGPARPAPAPVAAPVSISRGTSDRDAIGSPGSTDAIAPAAGFEPVAPVTQPASQQAPATSEIAALSPNASDDPDWGLMAALAALLGVGSAGAYAVTRRRKNRGRDAIRPDGIDKVSASVREATMPELRHEPVDAEMPRAANAAPAARTDQIAIPAAATADRQDEARLAVKDAFTDFVSKLPAFETRRGEAERRIRNADRRVAAAPRPYLTESDGHRPAGYFTAHVNSLPTAQNPFLTRQKRLKRAQYLDGKLMEIKAAKAKKPSRVSGKMQVSRRLEPALG